MGIKETFTKIYEQNLWGSKETRSGTGSELETTKELIKLLPEIFDKYDITGLADIGCGDCNWMRKVEGLKWYLGIDVVDKLIKSNNERFGDIDTIFECEEFPYWLANFYGEKYQAVMFADVFVHLPFYVAIMYIHALKKTNLTYIFATTFNKLSKNHNVELSDTSWRPLNMELEPFLLGEPLELLPYIEFYVGENGVMSDKSLGLWKL